MNMPLKHQRIGVVVIDQSPRPTVASEIAAVLSPGIEIELRGALDGMSRAEIDAIPPMDGYDTLFTLLPNGDGVTISKKEVERRHQLHAVALGIEPAQVEQAEIGAAAAAGAEDPGADRERFDFLEADRLQFRLAHDTSSSTMRAAAAMPRMTGPG